MAFSPDLGRTLIPDPAKFFSEPDEVTSSATSYQSSFSLEMRDEINDRSMLGRGMQEEIWAMEIAARDRRRLAETRSREAAGKAPVIDVFNPGSSGEKQAA